MIFQGCCFKNAGVAGYVEAFGIVQLENQASYIGYLFRNRCTRIEDIGIVSDILQRLEIETEEANN